MSDRPQVRTDLFDALWREFLTRMEEMVDARQMTMGAVVGRDGGKVRVRLDDENEDRTLGFPRGLGVAYQDGDRVAIGYSRTGEPMVLGVVSGGNGDGRVRNEQLDTDAVDARAIRSGTIKATHLAGDANIERTHFSQGLKNELSGKVDEGNGDEKVIRQKNLSSYAKNSAVENKFDKGKGEALEEKVKKLEREIANMKKKKDKKGA